MSGGNGKLRRLWVVWGVALAASLAHGADSPRSFSVQTLPREEIQSLSSRDWFPISPNELEEFRQRKRLPPDSTAASTVPLWKGTYEGTLDGARLRGELRFEVLASPRSAQWIALGDPDLFLDKLQWQGGGREAIWGTGPDGSSLLRSEPGAMLLAGEWALVGDQFLDRVQFSGRFASAAITDVVLHLPAGMQLASTTGLVEGPAESTIDGHRRWMLHLGRRSQADFTISPPGEIPRRGALLVREECIATAQSDGLDVFTEYELSPGSTGVISLTAPRGCRLISAMLGGEILSELQASSDAGGRTTAQLTLAGPLSTAGIRLRVRSFQPVVWNGPVDVSCPEIEGSVLLGRRVTLRVQRPYELRKHDADGYRFVDEQGDLPLEEVWTFEATRRAPRLTIDVSLPQAQLIATLTAWGDYTGSSPKLLAGLELQGSGAPVFGLRARLPAGWDVIDVAPPHGDSQTVLSGFRTFRDAATGETLLTFEFREPLPPQGTRQVVIRAIGDAALESDPRQLPPPVLKPVNFSITRGTVAVRVPAGRELTSIGDLRPTLPGTDERGRLATLVPGVRPEDMVTFETGDLGRFDLTGSLQFQATTSSALPAGSAATITPASGAITGQTGGDRLNDSPRSPVIGSLGLTTHLAAYGGQTHVHEARCHLAAPFNGVLTFRLDATASLSEVTVDDHPARVSFRQGIVTSAEPVSALHTIQVRYRTSAADEWLSQRESVVLPDWGPVRFPLRWSIVPSANRACAQVLSPFVRTMRETTPPWTTRLFGPLGRTGGPRGPTADVETDDDEGLPTTTKSRTAIAEAWTFGVRECDAITAPPVLAMRTWNTRAGWSASWVCVTAALLAGVALRLLRRQFARLGILLALPLTALAAWLLPLPGALLAGGTVAGLALATLLPETWLRRMSTPSADDRRSSLRGWSAPGSSLSHAVRALLLALWAAAALGQPADTPPLSASSAAVAQSPDAIVSKSTVDRPPLVYLASRLREEFLTWRNQRVRPPEYLFRRASYDIRINPAVMVEATYEVLLSRSDAPTAVHFPLNGATFLNTADCWIDGRRGTIIPEASGPGVVVEVPPSPRQPEGVASDWEAVAIRLKFRAAGAGGGKQGSLRCDVPRVANSTASISWVNQRPTRVECDARGGTLRQDTGDFIAWLGPAPHLDAAWFTRATSLAPQARSGLFAAPPITWIDLSPLRMDCRTVLPLPEAATRTFGRPLEYRLPATAWVRSVSAPAGVKTRLESRDDAQVLTIGLDRAPEPWQSLSIQYVLPVDPSVPSSGGVRVVPPLKGVALADQWVVVQPQPGLVFDLEPGGVHAPRELPAAELQTSPYVPVGVSRAGRAFVFTRQDELTATLFPRPSERRVSIEEQIVVRRAEADWSAVLQLSIDGAPVPSHAFQVDPRITIDRVSVEQDGAERMQRYTRDGDRLVVFLSRPAAGQQQARLTGRFRFPVNADVSLPEFAADDARVDSRLRTITNASDWQVTVNGPAGARSAAAMNPSIASLVRPTDDSSAATSFRVIPGPDVATADWVASIESVEKGWRLRCLGSVRPTDVPLTTLALRVPSSLDDYTLTPAGDVVERTRTDDQSERIVLRPTRFRGGEYRFRVQADLPLPSAETAWSLDPIALESAREGRTLVLLDPKFPFRPTSGCSRRGTIDDVPPALRPAANRPTPLVFVMTGLHWSWVPFSEFHGNLHVSLLETDLSLDAAAGVSGRTNLWCVTSGPARLSLSVPEGTSSVDARVPDGTMSAEPRNGIVEFDLPAGMNGEVVSVSWRQPVLSERIALPHVEGETAPHVVVVRDASDSGWRLEDAPPTEDVLLARLKALLDTIDLVSTHDLDLDGPVLTAIREQVTLLNRRLTAGGITETTRRATADELLARWDRLQQVIGVNVPPPGAGRSMASEAAFPGGRLLPIRKSVALLNGAPFEVVVLHRRAWLTAVWIVLALLAALAAAAFFLRGRSLPTLPAGITSRPGADLLLLGVLWIACFNVPLIGLLLLATASFRLYRGPVGGASTIRPAS